MPASNNVKRIPIRVERPNLRWIEPKLGESLQPLPQPPSYGVVKPQRDTRVIPMGDYCYHHDSVADGYAPCPYFKYTAYGTTRCIYTNVEAYDSGDLYKFRREMQKHFGSMAKAKAAGVIDMFDLPDATKICNVNMLNPSTQEHQLKPKITDYEQAVKGRRVGAWIYWSAEYAAMERNDACLQTAAGDRFQIWECLCSMIEPVPLELVHRIQLADAIFRGATSSSDVPIQNSWAKDLPAYPDPKKQFWYFYRKNFDNPFLGADQFSLRVLKNWKPSADMPLPLYVNFESDR